VGLQFGQVFGSFFGQSKPKTIVGGATFRVSSGLLGAGSSKKGSGSQSTAIEIGNAVQLQLADLRRQLGAKGPLSADVFDVYVYGQKGPAPIVINKFGKADPRPGYAARTFTAANDAVSALTQELLKRDSDVLGIGANYGVLRDAARSAPSLPDLVAKLPTLFTVPPLPAPVPVPINATVATVPSTSTPGPTPSSPPAVLVPGVTPGVTLLPPVTADVVKAQTADNTGNPGSAAGAAGLPIGQIAAWAIAGLLLIRLVRR
jgi:hypothetical protein